jgi:DNA repair protein RadC
LADYELVAAVVGAGRGSADVARELLAVYNDIATLSRVIPEDLMIRGVTARRAIALAAALELGRRSMVPRLERPQVRVSRDVYDFYRPRIGHLNHEVFHAMCLDSKHRLLRDQRIVEGGLSTCSVLPREAFSPALRASACAVIFVHNHPSGDATASADDLALTVRLKEAGQVLGIRVLDHVIVGEGCYVSLADEGCLAAL